MTNQQKFQVDLGGLIDLLSDHLYSGPEVYLRELLQNAVDALRAREQFDSQFIASESPIQIEVMRASYESPPTVVITDQGIGLTEDEVHEFLATIGQSSKRELSREEFIGQFGIGLLSGFIVSQEIVVITRSAKSPVVTLEWRGRSDGTYEVRQLEQEANQAGEPGTQVFLRAKPGCHDFLQRDVVQRLASLFASHLECPIEMVTDEGTERINITPPWNFDRSNTADYRQQCADYGEDVFAQSFVGMIPIHSQAGGVEGVAYILPSASRLKSKRGHRVYLKGMLLSESIDNLLPNWAFFVRSVVNSTKLRPTANREGFHEEPLLDETRAEIGECLKNYLVELSKNDRELLERIVALHHLSIKALAVEDDDFFDLVIDWLPFETSLGAISLGDYRKHQSSVRYCRTREEFRQIVGVAAAQKICIIDAGYTYDEELLQRLEQRDPSQLVQRLDVSELAQEFGELSIEERNATFDFLQFAQRALEEFGCEVQLKHFQPASLAALYTLNSHGGFLRSVDQAREVADDVWDSVLESVAAPKRESAHAQLCLNYENPLVRRLARLHNDELLTNALQMLYVQSLLLGHYQLRAKETAVLSDGLIGLIDAAVNND